MSAKPPQSPCGSPRRRRVGTPFHPLRGVPPLCPSESGAAAASGASASAASVALLAGHILRDGELVLLILRPSKWFILLSSLRFIASVATIVLLVRVVDDGSLYGVRYVEAGVFLMACRLMWGVLQWMGRLYILTDLRILRLSGVFHIDVFDCPLRRVARTHLEATLTEKLFRIGTIVIVPQDEELPIGTWQMVSQPKLIHEKIRSTVARAKQGG